MKETPEVLLKRTRSELSEMAEKLGIDTAGISKTKIADFIFEARNKTEKTPAKEVSKPGAEAPKAGKAFKARPMPHIGTNIGKKGVFAKRAAIDAQIKENEMAAARFDTGVKELQSDMDNKAREMLQEGAAKLQKGVDEMHKGINAQIKENEKASAKMGLGVKEMHKGINAQIKANEKAAAKMQEGIHELETKFGEFPNEIADYIKDFYYG